MDQIRYRSHSLVSRTVLIAVIYYASARLGLLLAVPGTNATPVWPPTGIALAAVLLCDTRVWPGIFAGAFLANLGTLSNIGLGFSVSAAAAASTAAGNTLEAVVGGALIRRFAAPGILLENVRDTAELIVLGALVCTVISATVGVITFCLATGNWSASLPLWFTWWLGDGTGVVLITPLMLALTLRQQQARPPVWRWEALVSIILLASVAVLVFRQGYRAEFLIIPILLWVAYRLETFETTLAVAVMSCIAVFSTVRTPWPSSGITLDASLLHLQSYIGVAAIVALSFSVAMKKQQQYATDLEKEKALAETIIDSIPGAFYVIDTAGRLVRWNRYLERLNDRSVGELQGMDILTSVHDEDKELVAGAIRSAFSTGEASTEARIRTNEGERSFFFTGKLIDAEGQPLVVGNGIEITDLKQAEQKLLRYKEDLEETVAERTATLQETNEQLRREIDKRASIELALEASKTKYQDIVENANSVILRWKPDGEITFFNRFAQQFFGYPGDEIIGQNIAATIVPSEESTGRDLSTLARDIAERPEAYVINENENIRKNGERLWVTWTNRPIRDENGQVEILSIGVDSTKRVQAERELRTALDDLAVAKEQAESADRLKSAFLATMSHELRTPLNSIIGFSGILLQGLAGPLNEEQQKQMRMVQKSSRHLLALINDVLDISKIEAGQLFLSISSFDLRPAIEKTVELVSPLAEKKGIDLQLEIADGVTDVTLDQRRLEQVILNLLNNAVKFTEEGRVGISCRTDKEHYLLSVSDTGIGIPPEEISGLFQPFHQVDTGLARKHEGTGLGLSICKKLMDMMGGTISVSSQWGQGSTFSIRFPRETQRGDLA